LHDLRAVPTVKGKALNSDAFSGPGAGNLHDDNDAIAIVMMIEKVSDVTNLKEFEQASIMAQLHNYHSDARRGEEIPEFCKNACRKGLKKLNMNQPALLVGAIPSEAPAAPAAASNANSPVPGMESLSPGSLTTIQNILVGFQTGTTDLKQIEEALGDKETGPVLQNILASPEVRPMMEKLVAKMSAGATE